MRSVLLQVFWAYFCWKKKGYKNILNLRSEFNYKSNVYDFINIKNIPVKEFTSPTFKDLDNASEFINSAILKNENIYIHCREGISRAPCFLAAYFVKYKNFTARDALIYIKTKRSFIKLLPNQINTLKNYERFLRNEFNN